MAKNAAVLLIFSRLPAAFPVKCLQYGAGRPVQILNTDLLKGFVLPFHLAVIPHSSVAFQPFLLQFLRIWVQLSGAPVKYLRPLIISLPQIAVPQHPAALLEDPVVIISQFLRPLVVNVLQITAPVPLEPLLLPTETFHRSCLHHTADLFQI